MRIGRRNGMAMTVTILALVLLLLAVGGASWTGHRAASSEYRGSLAMQRADQLARAAASEAFHRLQLRVNDPTLPGDAPIEEALDGWHRRVRAPLPGARRPAVTTRPTGEHVPAAATLARADGYTLAPVTVRCVAVRDRAGLRDGVVETTVVIRGGRGPWPVGRRLVERRSFYNVRTDERPSDEPLVTECVISPVPLARLVEPL
jgi:hypothetical protein